MVARKPFRSAKQKTKNRSPNKRSHPCVRFHQSYFTVFFVVFLGSWGFAHLVLFCSSACGWDIESCSSEEGAPAKVSLGTWGFSHLDFFPRHIVGETWRASRARKEPQKRLDMHTTPIPQQASLLDKKILPGTDRSPTDHCHLLHDLDLSNQFLFFLYIYCFYPPADW